MGYGYPNNTASKLTPTTAELILVYPSWVRHSIAESGETTSCSPSNSTSQIAPLKSTPSSPQKEMSKFCFLGQGLPGFRGYFATANSKGYPLRAALIELIGQLGIDRAQPSVPADD